jgi:hypothetical protein
MTTSCESSLSKNNNRSFLPSLLIPLHWFVYAICIHLNYSKLTLFYYWTVIRHYHYLQEMSTTPPISRHPYSSVLSALCKMELIWLFLEFKLPMDGSVIDLRNCLKCYLNFNCDTLYQNLRFNALFSRHRGNNPHLSPHPSSHTLCASSPDLSYRSLSPVESFTSWHWIENELHGSPVPSSLFLPVSSSSSGSEHGPPPPAVIQLDHCMLFSFFYFIICPLFLCGIEGHYAAPPPFFLYMIWHYAVFSPFLRHCWDTMQSSMFWGYD